jgi:hypothetical protein
MNPTVWLGALAAFVAGAIGVAMRPSGGVPQALDSAGSGLSDYLASNGDTSGGGAAPSPAPPGAITAPGTVSPGVVYGSATPGVVAAPAAAAAVPAVYVGPTSGQIVAAAGLPASTPIGQAGAYAAAAGAPRPGLGGTPGHYF